MKIEIYVYIYTYILTSKNIISALSLHKASILKKKIVLRENKELRKTSCQNSFKSLIKFKLIRLHIKIFWLVFILSFFLLYSSIMRGGSYVKWVTHEVLSDFIWEQAEQKKVEHSGFQGFSELWLNFCSCNRCYSVLLTSCP